MQLSSLSASGTTATATSATGLPAGLGVGSLVTVAGASPAAYDGTFVVASVSGSSFTYTMASSPGAASGSLITATLSQRVPVTALSSTNNGTTSTVTATTAVAHNLSAGASVTIANAASAGYNGTFTVASVVSPTQFTYTVNAVLPASDAGTDTFLTENTSAVQSLDNTISRVTALADHAGSGAGSLEGYTYLGLSTIVQRSRSNGVDLSYLQQTGDTLSSTDGGDKYTGLDRFGRIIDQFWVNSGTGSATDRFQYGYDPDGNVLFKNNLVSSSNSELYHANGSSNGYDLLNRLTNFQRGTR